MRRKQRVGQWGEKIAADYLQERGFRILDQNWRSPFGELDLIVRNEVLLAFIEVKTRTSATYGLPEEAVDLKKQEHLIASAQAYLQAHPELDCDWRIDVIAIQKNDTDACPQIEWFENAVH